MVNKTTIGIIGAGRIGKMHAENIVKYPNVKVKIISDIFTDHVQDWASDLGIEKVVNEYEEIIYDKEIDAIFVCSPTNTHAEIIIRDDKERKNNVFEKTISFSLEETKEVISFVRA